MFKKDQRYYTGRIEEIVRKRFKNIINGEGPIIPRIAVRVVVEGLFADLPIYYQLEDAPESEELCERCGYPENTHPRTTCWGIEPPVEDAPK